MTKEELKEYTVLKDEVVQLEEQIVFWEERKTSIKSQIISDMPRAEGESKELIDILVRIEDTIKNLNKKTNKLIKKISEIEDTIESLGATERVLMRYRYIDNLKMFQIAQK
ncbi:hypothetical protein L0P85_07000 [Terrisporobacter glycolicus]|nr:hypothetical protein L0P85_07000 [Terrisporobacter glycolicus]